MPWTCVTDNLPDVSKTHPDALRASSELVLVSYWVGESRVTVSRYVVPDNGRPYWADPDPECDELYNVTHWTPTPPAPKDSELPHASLVHRDGWDQWIIGDPEPTDKLKASCHCLADIYKRNK